MENFEITEEQKDALAHICRITDHFFSSWEGLYRYLEVGSDMFLANPTPVMAVSVVTLLRSFHIALRLLPDEGDALMIGRKMHEILVTRPDLTHVAFTSQGVIVINNMADSLIAALAKAEEETAAEKEPVHTGGRVLH